MKCALLSNFTVTLLAADLQKSLPGSEWYVAPYNSYSTEILNTQSALYKSQPDLICILLDGNTLFANRNSNSVHEEINSLVNFFRKNSTAPILISSIVLLPGVNKITIPGTENSFYMQNAFNNFLLELSSSVPGCHVLPVADLYTTHGSLALHDEALWLYGKVRYSKKGQQVIAGRIAATIRALLGQNKKCLVLDLDNTLWGGVIGEDGIDKIQLADNGSGAIYKSLQRAVKEIAKKGILLAVCSKNNEADAKEVFDKHPHSILQWNDFISKKINWQPKDENIHAIARELNIGEDSLVFIDDSPFERELVKLNTSAIVPEFPARVELLPLFFADIDENYFSRLSFTTEDLKKAEQYRENFARDEVRSSCTSLEQYIANLQITLTIREVEETDYPRAAQMTQKTNQFNLTTRRYTETDIHRMIQDEACRIFIGSAVDKVGDYGTIIMAIFRPQHATGYEIDTLLMSCRAIGRKIESYFVQHTLAALGTNGPLTVTGVYIPTPKNELVKDFYDENGFTFTKLFDDGSKLYSIDSAAVLLPEHPIIKVLHERNN
ncbi:MAG: HAD-IIIC family phosphatase [Ignavibacteria bacterium]|nr:HAD-IIIC family phosphatase [Ignavibacteria bacterium]